MYKKYLSLLGPHRKRIENSDGRLCWICVIDLTLHDLFSKLLSRAAGSAHSPQMCVAFSVYLVISVCLPSSIKFPSRAGFFLDINRATMTATSPREWVILPLSRSLYTNLVSPSPHKDQNIAIGRGQATKQNLHLDQRRDVAQLVPPGSMNRCLAEEVVIYSFNYLFYEKRKICTTKNIVNSGSGPEVGDAEVIEKGEDSFRKNESVGKVKLFRLY